MTDALRSYVLCSLAFAGLLTGCGGDTSSASASSDTTSGTSGTSGTAATASSSRLLPRLSLGPIVPASSSSSSGAGTRAAAGTTASSSSGSGSSTSSGSSSSGGSFASTTWTAATFAGHGVRGFNQPGDFSAKSFSDMAATGANLVRVFVPMNLNASQSQYTFDLGGVDAAVSSGAQNGFKVIITFQPITSSSVPEFWNSSSLQASLVANWVATAGKYNGNPTVAAYDLINEPTAPGGESQWQSLALQMMSAIRNVDAAHTIIFEPSPGGLPEAFSGLTPITSFSNLVYSVHFYEPYGFTHQGILTQVSTSYPAAAGSPIGQVDKSTLYDKLAPVRQFAASSGLPIYVGEFSAVRWASGANTYVSDAIALFEAAGWSWSYHEWRGWPGWDAELPETWFSQFPMVNAMPQGWQNTNFAPARTDTTDTMVLLKGYFELNTH